MIDYRKAFIDKAAQQAESAGHIYPTMAACEAALESAFGLSKLANDGNNLFGMKQHFTPLYDTLLLPTREFLNDKWVTVDARWIKYPDWAACFRDRMDTLKRLSHTYPHYAEALAAPTAEAFVTAVSLTWSTDPMRASKVLSIHASYLA